MSRIDERRRIDDEMAAIIAGDHGDPFAFLGMHGGFGEPIVVRTFLPDAEAVAVVSAETGAVMEELPKLHPAGFFAGEIRRQRTWFPYRLRVRWPGATVEMEDAYRFPPILGELDVHLLGEGRHLRLYEKLGAQRMRFHTVEGTAFAVWAPNARRVSVVGPFCNWDGRRLPMRLRRECGVWEIFVPNLGEGALYKFEIKGPHGEILPLKADPHALYTEKPPQTASIVYNLDRVRIDDKGWMLQRAKANDRHAPISIYECHLESWARVAEEGNRPLTYRELGERLVPYVCDLGFTHLELLPVSEYPFSGSWGYQPISLFAPTSRFGTPADFAWFVERCHAAGLALWLDWVPGHFPTDAHGLARFDGTHLYEHADPRQGLHQDWNTLIYNYGRREVANFLLSNALFWLDRYHIDGLRVDAVASMLYLDYSRKPGEWIPNQYGGNENLDAIALLRRMNELTFGDFPGATTAAEESTAWPGVSRPTYLGGLGFGYKWNMGWMHDTLRYMNHDPIHRRWRHHDMTFGLLYAFSENFILPLSHDEVVHGKGSLLGKMPGNHWQKFANLRAYFGFMFAHPGKKLLFMGGEFGQEREWNHDASLDWRLLDQSEHRGLQNLIRDLNRAYREVPALHQLDTEAHGFEWIEANDADNSVFAFLRRGFDQDRIALAVSSFTPVIRHDYRVGVPRPGFYAERINTDSDTYGGSNVGNAGGVSSEPVPWNGQPHSICLTLPPLATVILERQSRS